MKEREGEGGRDGEGGGGDEEVGGGGREGEREISPRDKFPVTLSVRLHMESIYLQQLQHLLNGVDLIKIDSNSLLRNDCVSARKVRLCNSLEKSCFGGSRR